MPTTTAPAESRPNDLLERLKRSPKQRGEASFFFYDSAFRSVAARVLPGEYFVSNEELMITTTLGSCIAVCLWDPHSRVGGLNHFMLPDEGGQGSDGRHGAFAMEMLINAMMKRGAMRSSLQAKIFGGARLLGGADQQQVGERNTRFAISYLSAERIALLSKDVLEGYARKVCFLPTTGKAMVKRMNMARPEEVLATEKRQVRETRPVGGTVDLF